jgi:hypothetical protein
MTKTNEEFVPITVQEMYAEDNPSDFVSWTVCRYINRLTGRKDKCDCCPSSRPDKHFPDDEVIDGCRLVGEELARYVMVALKREGWTPPSKG